jgi:hypothetical protein
MTADKYQITEKAAYLNLFLLKDELKSFHEILSREIVDADSWLVKLRTTRHVFLTLNNVREAANRITLNGPAGFIAQTRNLKKKLSFVNHFRNRAIGHLDNILLERAVQWSPQLFYTASREHEDFKAMEAHRSVIEACINSFIDQDGFQKVFKTEIDLMYPPDADLFFRHLFELVTESIEWLSGSSDIVLSSIKHHDEDEIQELGAIAGQTNFDLKVESTYSYSLEDLDANLASALEKLKALGVGNDLLEFIKSLKT